MAAKIPNCTNTEDDLQQMLHGKVTLIAIHSALWILSNGL
jgi:hypothetical protein